MVLTPRQRQSLSFVRNPSQKRKMISSYNRQNAGRVSRYIPRPIQTRVYRQRNFLVPQRPVVNNRRPFNTNFQSRSLTVPVSRGFRFRTQQSSDYVMSRSGFMAELSKPENFAKGYRCIVVDVHPGNIPTVRNIALHFEKYTFKNFSVRLVPNVGSDVNGMCFVGFSYDRHHKIASDIVDAQCYDKFTTSTVWSPTSWISIPNNILSDKWYDAGFKMTETGADKLDGDSFHDFAAARVVFGFSGLDFEKIGDNGTVALLEVKFTIVLSRPTPAPDIITKPAMNVLFPSSDNDILDLSDSLSRCSLCNEKLAKTENIDNT